MAQRLHDLAVAFSVFWERCPVLRAEPDVRAARLGLAPGASPADVRQAAEVALERWRTIINTGRVPYEGPPEEAARLVALADEMGNPALVRGIELLGQVIADVRGPGVADPRLVLEVALVRMARREARTREETLLERIERLEQRVANGATGAAARTPAPALEPRPA